MTNWVLLRGLTRETRHWGAFPQILRSALEDTEGGVDIVTPDLPGNGALHRQNSPDEIGAMVEACRALLAGRHGASPFSLLAMSLGAMVACEWARRYPREIGRMVLINTSLRPFSPFHRRMRPGNYARLLRLALDWRSPLACERRILAMTSRFHADDEPLAKTWAEWRAQNPVSTGNALRQLRAAARYRVRGAAPLAPTLLLAGAKDALVDPACSADIARAWGWPLRVHPDAGHDLPLDDSAWVAGEVAAWCMPRQED